MAKAGSRLSGLDALRSIAIVQVVVTHGAMTFMPGLPGVGGAALWLIITTNFGVPLFFVLSGFLVTRQLAQGMPTRVFYKHRIAKIYPTFALAVIVYGFLAKIDNPITWSQYFLGIHNTSTLVSSKIGGHLWSLAVEMQFYLLAPLMFVLGYRYLSGSAVALIAALVFFGHGGYLLMTPDVGQARLVAVLNVYQWSTFNFCALFLGAWLYKSYTMNERWRGAVWALLACTLAMPLLNLYFLPSLQIQDLDFSSPISLLAMLVFIAFAPLASIFLGHMTLKQGLFKGQNCKVIFGLIASISYQWYLWHPVVLIGARRASQDIPEFNNWLAQNSYLSLIGYLIISFILAWIIYLVIERPLHQSMLKLNFSVRKS